MGLCSVPFLLNHFGKAIMIAWRGGRIKASPRASQGWKEKPLCEGTSEARDKIPIRTSLSISSFKWGGGDYPLHKRNTFLPEPSEMHCVFPLD